MKKTEEYGISMILDENGTATDCDDRYSVTIMNHNAEEMERTMEFLENCHGWTPVEEELPEVGKLVLLSFEGADFTTIGWYTVDDKGNGTFRDVYDNESFASSLLFVNAWMPMPEPYKRKNGGTV